MLLLHEVYMRKFVVTVFMSVLFLSACQSKAIDLSGEIVDVNGGSYSNINSQQLNTMLKNKDFVLVNVHVPFAGDIPNTDLSIPYNQIAESQYLAQLPIDKNSKIVLYCRSGRMSQIAAEELVSQGYTNVWNLKDGMVEWEQAGYSLDQ